MGTKRVAYKKNKNQTRLLKIYTIFLTRSITKMIIYTLIDNLVSTRQATLENFKGTHKTVVLEWQLAGNEQKQREVELCIRGAADEVKPRGSRMCL